MDLDPPFPANAIKDPFGYSGDESSAIYSPQRQHQAGADTPQITDAPACYPWGYDSPRLSSFPVYVPFTFPWSLPVYHPSTDFSSTIAPDEVMVHGLYQEQQPVATPSFTAASTSFDSSPDIVPTPSLPQLSDASDDSDSEYETPIGARSQRPTNASRFYSSSSSGVSVPGSVLQGEQAPAAFEVLPDDVPSMHDLESIGLSEADLVGPHSSALGLEVEEDDPFVDLDQHGSQHDLSFSHSHAAWLDAEGEDELDTPPLTPITPASPTLHHDGMSESESAPGTPSSTRLVPGPGSVISDDEYIAAAHDDDDGEGEDELDDLPPSPVTPPTRKRASSSSSATKKTFKDGLWDAINNPDFEDDIYWAEDGLSGEIPDRRQFERSAAMRAITDARNVSGFVRQLHMWGFHRFKRGGVHSLCFTHPLFRRDEPELRRNISRKGENKYRARRTKRKQKKSKKGTSSASAKGMRKSTRSSARHNYNEGQSPAPSSDPEIGSDYKEPRPLKRSRRGQGSTSVQASSSSRLNSTATSKPESSGRSSSRRNVKAAAIVEDLSRSSSPEPAKPSLSTIRPKVQRNRRT